MSVMERYVQEQAKVHLEAAKIMGNCRSAQAEVAEAAKKHVQVWKSASE